MFWILLTFGFDKPHTALLTLLSAALHELGHQSFLLLSRGRPGKMRAGADGPRISAPRLLSYGELILLYLCGPLSNILVFLFSSLLAPAFGDYALEFALINLFTALSNLLPIKGLDGYGILKALIARSEKERLLPVLCALSFFLTALLMFFALYLAARLDGGYFVYALFLSLFIKETAGLEKN